MTAEPWPKRPCLIEKPTRARSSDAIAGNRADRLAMIFGKKWSLKNYENNKPCRDRWPAHDRVVPSRNAACRPPDARRPAVAEPLDVLADDPERRRKPARDECGRALARGLMLVPDRRTHTEGEERCTRPALHDQCRHERLRRHGFRRSAARDRPEGRGGDRGVVGEKRMARAARRFGNRHHRAVQRADARSAAVVRLRSQGAHRNRSRHRRRDARFNALAVLKSARTYPEQAAVGIQRWDWAHE